MKLGAGHSKPGLTAFKCAWRRRFCLPTVLLCVSLGVAQGQMRSAGEEKKLSPELSAWSRGSASNQPVEVIVQFKHAPASSTVQRLPNLGGVRRQSLGLIC